MKKSIILHTQVKEIDNQSIISMKEKKLKLSDKEVLTSCNGSKSRVALHCFASIDRALHERK